MSNVVIDFADVRGVVKPMHAVNNGPVYKYYPDQRITNVDHFKDAGIPYVRTHDASFNTTYGGEHTVDVHNIFKNFDNDPYDAASYDFRLTDEYLKVIEMGGSKTFYRLGSKIEHWPVKYGTLMPTDFKKWAVICEHIIRHYTEGWADGFHFDIEYWEIWNEADLDPDDSDHKRCWGGTKKDFFEFYDVSAKHLKACFPHLKIGGPAVAGNRLWMRDFLAQLDAPLDFFSWHVYAKNPRDVERGIYEVREMLDENGYEDTLSILNEWNYVIAFSGDNWVKTLKAEKSIKGAAFVAATMAICQSSPVDMLMYYDARPCVMNGLFDTDFVNERLKGYYSIRMFNELYKLGTSVGTDSDNNNIYASAATNGSDAAAAMVVHFSTENQATAEPVKIGFSGLSFDGKKKVSYYLLDDAHDLELVREEIFSAEEFSAYLTLKQDSAYLILLEAV